MKSGVFCFAFLLCLIMKLEAEALPKIEAGIALGGQYLADYRGSSEYNTRLVPLPFFLYRGKRIKVDRRGVRSELLSTVWWEVNVSGEVSLSGGNGDNRLRQGMPELDSTFELGPSLNFSLSQDGLSDGWLFRLPIRAVVSVGAEGIDHQGWLFNPKFTYIYNSQHRSWRSSTNIGFNIGSNKYHDYYYRVAPKYATELRPVYNSGSGYSGAFIKTSLIRRSGNWRYGVSVRYDNLSESVFLQSPLVETKNYYAISFILARFLWRDGD